MKNLSHYSKLAEITQLINSKLDLQQCLEQVVIAISEEIVQCDSVGIFMSQPDGTFRGYVGKPDEIHGMNLDQLVVDPQTDLLAYEIIEKRKIIYIPDTAKDNRPNPALVEFLKIKSLLALPMFYEEEIFGLVQMFIYNSTMHLTDVEIQTVEAYVNMAAVAIRNAKLFAHKKVLLSEKQLLLDATSELSLCLTIPEVLDTCFHYAGKALNNTNIGAHLNDMLQKKTHPSKHSNEADWKDDDWKKVFRETGVDFEDDLVFREVIEAKKPLFIPNVALDHRPNNQICEKFGIKGLFIMPLVAMGEVIGTVAAVSLRMVRNYQKSELQLAQSIVDATATALANIIQKEKLEEIIDLRTVELMEKNSMLEKVITDLKRQQLELTRLERLNLIGQLAAGISHEIRNPLTTVKGFLQLLGSRSNYHQDKEYMDLMVSEIDRANAIITDFLLLAKSNSDNIQLQSINDIINKIFPLIQADAYIHNKDIVLNLNIVPPILANENEIKQLILNLVRNGLDVTPEHGYVKISTYKEEAKVVLRVKDWGPGIPQAIQEKIGTPFFTTKDTGTGLGLAISIGIAQRHKATFNFKTSNDGTIFDIVFPLAEV
ncbi:MAG: GAF domain-containing protein [Desulfosporosinus sp.]|nr:GAF domain-containing protein [Desulfosporosinus sp.]